MFRRKSKTDFFDRESERPVIRASICTGEKVAGFKNIRTGRFTEVMLIRGQKDLDTFRKQYGIAEKEIFTEY